MVEPGPEPAKLTQSFKSGRSFIHTLDFNGNQISPLAGFSMRASLGLWEMDERWRWNQIYSFKKWQESI